MARLVLLALVCALAMALGQVIVTADEMQQLKAAQPALHNNPHKPAPSHPQHPRSHPHAPRPHPPATKPKEKALSQKSDVSKEHLHSVPWPATNQLNRDPFGANELPTMTDLKFGSKDGLARNANELPPPLKAQCVEDDGGDGPIKMAMLVPSSTNGLGQVAVKDLPLVKFFIPSFKKTTANSKRFQFHLYLGYDLGDPFYDNPANVAALRQWIVDQNVGLSNEQLHFVQLQKAKLVHLWNQLFDKAYADGMHYFYQVGDDIEHKTDGWADAFVDTLRRNPVARNFGVVGPSDCKLTVPWVEQACVARIHKRIVGTLFDPQFIDASCDVWLSQAYGISNSYYLTDVQVWNVLRTTRYKARPGTSIMEQQVRTGRRRACAWLMKCSDNAHLACDMLRQDPITIAFKSMRPDVDRRSSVVSQLERRYTIQNRFGQAASLPDAGMCRRAANFKNMIRRILS